MSAGSGGAGSAAAPASAMRAGWNTNHPLGWPVRMIAVRGPNVRAPFRQVESHRNTLLCRRSGSKTTGGAGHTRQTHERHKRRSTDVFHPCHRRDPEERTKGRELGIKIETPDRNERSVSGEGLLQLARACRVRRVARRTHPKRMKGHMCHVARRYRPEEIKIET